GRGDARRRPKPAAVARVRRRALVRKRVRGAEARPRLSGFRSDRHTYVQVIADSAGKTLLAVSTLTPELRAQLKKTADVSAAKQVGLFAARRCLEKEIGRASCRERVWVSDVGRRGI